MISDDTWGCVFDFENFPPGIISKSITYYTDYDNIIVIFDFENSLLYAYDIIIDYAYSLNSILRGIFHFPLVDNLFTICKGIITDNK